MYQAFLFKLEFALIKIEFWAFVTNSFVLTIEDRSTEIQLDSNSFSNWL